MSKRLDYNETQFALGWLKYGVPQKRIGEMLGVSKQAINKLASKHELNNKDYVDRELSKAQRELLDLYFTAIFIDYEACLLAPLIGLIIDQYEGKIESEHIDKVWDGYETFKERFFEANVRLGLRTREDIDEMFEELQEKWRNGD